MRCLRSVTSVGKKCYERATDPQFAWDTVASQFGGIFEEVLSQEAEPAAKPKEKRKERKDRAKTRKLGK
jgi:hypothetical protein